MPTVEKVALAGATGNIGPAILEQLLLAGFEVTVLTRKDSQHKFPDKVKVAKVDYDSFDSIHAALEGQDAVISTLPSSAFDIQLHLVDAAAQAGVQRFIPSEFGCDTYNPKARYLPLLNAPKAKTQEYLANKAEETDMTYTLICSGPILDWCLMIGLFLDFKNQKAEFYDGGDVKFSTTTLAGVGRSVVGVLKNLEATKNRPVYVNEAVVTQKQLLAYAEEFTNSKWETSVISTEESEKEGRAELMKSKPDYAAVAFMMIKRAIWGKGMGSQFEKPENDLLGVKLLSEKEIRDLVGEYT